MVLATRSGGFYCQSAGFWFGGRQLSWPVRRLTRHYKNVHTDVTRLIELGLIERLTDRKVAVMWDVVSAEMRLAA